MGLKYYTYIFNQYVIQRHRGLEAIRHITSSRVRGDSSYNVIDVERVKLNFAGFKFNFALET